MKRRVKLSGIAGVVGLLFLAGTSQLLAQETLQTGGSEAHFGTHRLVDSETVRLTTGGNLNAATLNLGSGCMGWVTATPDVIIQWRERSDADLHFAMEAQGDGDTTLVIRSPDGRWHCNDDTSGLNPEVWINGPSRGQYDVWIGSYARQEQLRGTLTVEGSAPRPQLQIGGTASNFGTHRLTSTQTIQVRSGGDLNAGDMSLGSGCLGSTTAIPDAIIHWNGGSDLRFAVQADGDTTLLINSADGNWHCNDDTHGLNPEVLIQNAPRGQYDVWVGSYENGAQLPATLTASAGGAVANQPPAGASAVVSLEREVQAAQRNGRLRVRDTAPVPGGTPRRIPRFEMPPLLLRLVQARDAYVMQTNAAADPGNLRVAYQYSNALLMYFYGDWQQAKRRFSRIYGERCTSAQAHDTGTQAGERLREIAAAEGNTPEVQRLTRMFAQGGCARPPR